MGKFQFRQRIKIAKGVSLNLSKPGAGVSTRRRRSKIFRSADGRLARICIAVLCLSIAGPYVDTATAASSVRSIVDRPDDVSGYQVHLVYVVPNGSTDLNADTNGQIDAWVKEGNAWLSGKVGRGFQFDTFQGMTDVTFLSSKYRVPELCRENCNTLSKLKDEYIAQNPTFDNSKTLFFMFSDKLGLDSCGWAYYNSNLALAHNLGDTGDQCNRLTSKASSGLTYPAKIIIHELIHTFGIYHVCMDSSDLMIGTPECTIDNNTFGQLSLTLDSNRNQYIGSDLAFGIDLLKMPVWDDGSGIKTYSEMKQISDKKYVPRFKDGTVYAVIGKQSGEFAWDWENKIFPNWAGLKCQFSSGLVTVIGTQSKSACVFDVPNSLRAGKAFTVTQSWVKGPWHGEASISGVLVREDFSATPCTQNTCFVGGTSSAYWSCWTKDVKSLTLQQLVDGAWVDFKTVETISGSKCLSNDKFVNYPELALDFQQTGLFIYRWVVPNRPGIKSYIDTAFAIIVNDENSAEPSTDEIASAQTSAIELGKAADALAAEQATAKAADALAAEQAAAKAASKKTTITCVKGKLTKKVTAVKPKCPKGYKVKR
jgi:hypothetical protein